MCSCVRAYVCACACACACACVCVCGKREFNIFPPIYPPMTLSEV